MFRYREGVVQAITALLKDDMSVNVDHPDVQAAIQNLVDVAEEHSNNPYKED